ncbi:oxidoreductase [Arthrobacter agilis]|uniref:molybdopterin-dependent oxidoreductase n=1 Tax=Arthrobacter agilis TaxID=37921 RepID=UPI000B35227E|nr:molybdopterin-dependent oxidoreductase [Arthrobacter agilis]OUM43048.1 oxidoreductase [Arthrobacter agilis]PPB45993.1 oxidoreductase [Arthrobacter agilis]TPV25531.1 oxidoreductase [Arthrobacter agilis]VDR33289.1 Sulfoxide reductase catalytic subunit yedY precursor [Arthrobacter agilis]
MSSSTKPRRGLSALAALAGIIAAGVVLGIAELAGAFFRASATPVIALGSTFIDFTPPWMKDFAIETFGTNDKLALLVGMGITIALLAAVLGIVAFRRWVLGVAGVLLMGAIILASVLTRAGSSLPDALPTIVGTAAGLLALRVLIARLRRTAVGDPAGASTATTAMTAATGGRGATGVTVTEKDDAATGQDGNEREGATAASLPSAGTSRRGFFAAVGVTAVVAAVAAGGGRLLAGARNNIAAVRDSLAFPAPASPAPALPAGVHPPVPGLTPFVTPNDDFYRIDTALSVPQLTADDWVLRVHGMVEEEFELSFRDLLDADLIERHVTLTCVSNPVGGYLAGNAKWLGYPLREVLARARPLDGADMVLSTSSDGFSASTPLPVLQDERDAMLAVAMNGEPLPVEHGFPVRMVVPGLYGYVSATKWVVDLEVTRFADRTAYWTDRGWAEKGPIKTMARVEVPQSFASLEAGTVMIGGTAWSQHRGITKVEVSVDNGDWEEVTLAAEASVDTWRQWSHELSLESGLHTVRSRATDAVDGLQTEERADTVPDGASGWQSVQFTVK